VSFAAGLREPICTLYGGQSIDCSPTRYQIDCETDSKASIFVVAQFNHILSEAAHYPVMRVEADISQSVRAHAFHG
jgi:hypothetical protein